MCLVWVSPDSLHLISESLIIACHCSISQIIPSSPINSLCTAFHPIISLIILVVRLKKSDLLLTIRENVVTHLVRKNSGHTTTSWAIGHCHAWPIRNCRGQILSPPLDITVSGLASKKKRSAADTRSTASIHTVKNLNVSRQHLLLQEGKHVIYRVMNCTVRIAGVFKPTITSLTAKVSEGNNLPQYSRLDSQCITPIGHNSQWLDSHAVIKMIR